MLTNTIDKKQVKVLYTVHNPDKLDWYTPGLIIRCYHCDRQILHLVFVELADGKQVMYGQTCAGLTTKQFNTMTPEAQKEEELKAARAERKKARLEAEKEASRKANEARANTMRKEAEQQSDDPDLIFASYYPNIAAQIGEGWSVEFMQSVWMQHEYGRPLSGNQFYRLEQIIEDLPTEYDAADKWNKRCDAVAGLDPLSGRVKVSGVITDTHTVASDWGPVTFITVDAYPYYFNGTLPKSCAGAGVGSQVEFMAGIDADGDNTEIVYSYKRPTKAKVL